MPGHLVLTGKDPKPVIQKWYQLLRPDGYVQWINQIKKTCPEWRSRLSQSL
ncbi:hypothetical protein EYZ11_012681 [Aspergillus tanneri]|uniref:Uncharacterized protein n=1 Tax=Aspergillus tanneri TaxID=1220188 RepID=A0A4S3IZL7_9EURO|nr:hypothetical protein EYZ11_012681 [Aspergillus tanneri]